MFKIVNSEHLPERFFVFSEQCSKFAPSKKVGRQQDANKKEAAT